MQNNLTIKKEDYYQGGRPEMLKYVPVTSKKILDIGCGEGNFGVQLKKQNQAEVWGVEYEPVYASMASKKLDKVFCGDITSLLEQLPNDYFDAIICNDVLEHLTDPYKVLETLQSKLASGGIIVSSLPNIRYFRNFFDLVFKKNWDYADQGVMDFTHYRFFTINSIRKMYEALNYEIIIHEGVHPTKSLRPWLLIILSFGYFSDIRYLQFATVAKPVR